MISQNSSHCLDFLGNRSFTLQTIASLQKTLFLQDLFCSFLSKKTFKSHGVINSDLLMSILIQNKFCLSCFVHYIILNKSQLKLKEIVHYFPVLRTARVRRTTANGRLPLEPTNESGTVKIS